MSPLFHGMPGNLGAMEKMDGETPTTSPEWVEVNGK